ncbi:hypothetical protein ACFL4U_02300 [Candidatus Neomarinimicrobiota bacterium]
MKKYNAASIIISALILTLLLIFGKTTANADISNGFSCWHWISIIGLGIVLASVLMFIGKGLYESILALLNGFIGLFIHSNKDNPSSVETLSIADPQIYVQKTLGAVILHFLLFACLVVLIIFAYKYIYYPHIHVLLITAMFLVLAAYEFWASSEKAKYEQPYKKAMGDLLLGYDGPTFIAFSLLFIFLIILNKYKLCSSLSAYPGRDIFATGSIGFHMIISTCSIIHTRFIKEEK